MIFGRFGSTRLVCEICDLASPQAAVTTPPSAQRAHPAAVTGSSLRGQSLRGAQATKQSSLDFLALDCFAALAMTELVGFILPPFAMDSSHANLPRNSFRSLAP